MMNTKRTLFIILTSVLMFATANVNAQFPFIQRQVWDGPYDIKMIAAPNLQAVFINSSEASSSRLKADSIIRYSTMMMSATKLDINNRYKGGSPFVSISGLTQPAFLCPDINAPCMNGIPTVTPNSSCPAPRYGDPITVPNVYVSMTYADYDNDMSTYSSSMAELDISSCSEIEAAYLYWTGMFRGSNDAITLVPTAPFNSYSGPGTVFNTSTTSGHNQVRFKIPGGTYQTVTATAGNTRNDTRRYLCVADVTTLVQGTGGGQFWVGNLQSYPNDDDGGSTSGWALVVVFRSPLSPPRRISLWDGLESIAVNTSRTFTLTGIQAPATGNFNSYVGFGALDGENISQEGITSAQAEGLGFQTNNGGSLIEINPNKTDQPHYRMWKDGTPAKCDRSDNTSSCKTPLFDANWCTTYDGISSQKITSYNETTGLNGNEIVRLPNNKNTLGFDAHHMKLPAGAVAAGATTATLTVKAGPQGGTTPFLAYVAIERLQPKLEMTKTANKNTTALNTQITYTLRIKNKGNAPSIGGDIIYDTLDIATDYAGGLTSIRYVNGAATTPAPGVTLLTSTSNRLQINLANPIGINDSVDISFNVQVKDYPSNVALWDVQCKRTIENTAYIKYNTATSGILQSKSNSNDCGIGSETKVLVFDAQLDASTATVLGPFDACTYLNDAVVPHIRSRLVSNGGVSSAVVNDFDIRNSSYVRLDLDDKFSTVPNNTMSFFAIRDFSSSGNCQQVFEVKFSSCILPVQLISFNGWKNQHVNVLVWTTASEENNKEFIVERSTDGKHFIPIGLVKGGGTTSATSSYRFDDEKPFNGENYYRLRQVDDNGAFTYSNVISVSNEKADINIYPNPNDGSFTIRMVSADHSYQLDITEISGREVYSTSGEIVPQSIEMHGLAKGIYFVRLNAGNETVIKKMVVF